MKWGTLYAPAYVNVMHSAVRRHLTGTFRFVCLTDDAKGLDPAIDAYPIPDIGYQPSHWKGGGWPKLSVFVKDLYGLSGRALFLDLDTAVVSSIDSLFDEPGDLIAVGGGKGWAKPNSTAKVNANTSVFAFDLGGQTQIVDTFQRDGVAAQQQFGLEQDFIEHHATSWKPWPKPWVVSFKRHLRQPILLDRFLPVREPTADTRIVAFHGRPRPLDVVRPGRTSWAEFPHYGRGPVDWMRNYWLENGYRDDDQPLESA